MNAYRLGAEELIELGQARRVEDQARRPYFQSRQSLGSQMAQGGIPGLSRTETAVLLGIPLVGFTAVLLLT